MNPVPSQKSHYVRNFMKLTKQHSLVATTGNSMYALFGFMNDQSKVYKIFQRVPAHLNFNGFHVIHILTVATKSFVYCSPSIDHEEESCPK
jgi:hypothetical protein